MSDKPKVEFNGWGLMLPLLTVLFVGLKLTGHIDWSWVWVLSPVWIGFVVAAIVAGLAAGILAVWDKNK